MKKGKNLLHKYRTFGKLAIVFVEDELERHPNNNKQQLMELYHDIQTIENQLEDGING